MASKNLAKYLFDEKMVKKNLGDTCCFELFGTKTALHTKVHICQTSRFLHKTSQIFDKMYESKHSF